MSIGDEVVPLVELAGAGQDTSAVFAELEVEPVSDSRWHSVQSVLERIRSAAGGTASVVAATQQLSEQLRTLFSMSAELASADAETLWTDAQQLQQLRQSVETDIELCLAAVQQLHQLSLERRQAALSDSDLSSVHRAVDTLKAEIEAGQQDSDARRKLMQRLAQRQRS